MLAMPGEAGPIVDIYGFDDDAEYLPRAALMHVCLCIATDPEPLLTLSARLRTLMALSGVDRAMRIDVHAVAVPALVESFVPIAQVRRHKSTTRPTTETLVRESDAGVRKIASDTQCRSPLSEVGFSRRKMLVDRLLEVSASDVMWALVPVKAELRKLRSMSIRSLAEARSVYRLRAKDLVGFTRGGLLCEDLADIALARHGSWANMQRAKKTADEIARKRAMTISDAAARRRELSEAHGVAAWQRAIAVCPELGAAETCYVRHGGDERRAAAVSIFSRIREVVNRRTIALNAILPDLYVSPDGVTLSSPFVGPNVAAAVDAYRWSQMGDDALADGMAWTTVSEFVIRWRFVVDLWNTHSRVRHPHQYWPCAVSWIDMMIRAYLDAEEKPQQEQLRIEVVRSRESWTSCADVVGAHNVEHGPGRPKHIPATIFEAAMTALSFSPGRTHERVIEHCLKLLCEDIVNAAHVVILTLAQSHHRFVFSVRETTTFGIMNTAWQAMAEQPTRIDAISRVASSVIQLSGERRPANATIDRQPIGG